MSRPRRDSENSRSRRSFLQSALATGAASALYPALGAARAAASSASEGSASPGPNPEVKPFELDEITIAELQEGMKSGRFTARSLVENTRRALKKLTSAARPSTPSSN
jgi:nitrous oxide reductase